ncbi:uncharacterized protein LOC119711472 [Motacilla alba alba]|uniref:uncharacterized protein LOC119711472 n=1 Tax=Motacilla alba alba TaxID=1094192 RepID=UPI0018D59521|nr:uncharacterized protein LOC119711472 [Motacilla alba alba]
MLVKPQVTGNSRCSAGAGCTVGFGSLRSADRFRAIQRLRKLGNSAALGSPQPPSPPGSPPAPRSRPRICIPTFFNSPTYTLRIGYVEAPRPLLYILTPGTAPAPPLRRRLRARGGRREPRARRAGDPRFRPLCPPRRSRRPSPRPVLPQLRGRPGHQAGRGFTLPAAHFLADKLSLALVRVHGHILLRLAHYSMNQEWGLFGKPHPPKATRSCQQDLAQRDPQQKPLTTADPTSSSSSSRCSAGRPWPAA